MTTLDPPSTPEHRFRFWLADASQRDAAIATLTDTLSEELTVEPVTEPDGRVRLEIVSTFGYGGAMLRPLNVLKRAGIAARGLEVSGLVTDVDDASLRRMVEEWDRFANVGPYRHRLEVLSGMPLLERCLAGLERAPEGGPGRPSAWSLAVRLVAFNTPGSERRTVLEASRADDRRRTEWLVGAAIGRVDLARLIDEPIDVPHQALASLIGRPGYVSERASYLAALLPAPLPEAVAGALCQVATTRGERAVEAARVLGNAAPSEAIRDALQAAMRSDEAELRAAALGSFAELWGTEARPVWREFLASRSVPMRWTAEDVLGAHGAEEDLDDAAGALARLIRARSSVEITPPRGNEIVRLLVRHRDHPVARAALDDLSARWDRLGNDLRRWLVEHHPWLDPARRSDEPQERAIEAEDDPTWPPPTIERHGGTLTLHFDEGAAHAEARERFEALLEAHPSVEVLDADREWLSARISGPDPERLIDELWATAWSPGPSEG